MKTPLDYLAAYPAHIQQQAQQLVADNKLAPYLLNKYPSVHSIGNDGQLRDYVLALKAKYLKQAEPLSKVVFDTKIHVINNALGLHSHVARVQGSRLKTKREIRVSTVFKKTPEAFLQMIVVHELAHLKEMEHNKNFYQLCQHMLPDYFQLELDTRLFLVQLELEGNPY